MMQQAESDKAAQDRFVTLLERHSSMVFSIAMRMLGDHGIAEEVAQDVFLSLHRSLPKLESDEHVTYWLRRTATHRATDAIRRRRVRPEAAADEWGEVHERNLLRMGAGSLPSRHVVVSARLERALLALPPQQRAAVVLRHQEDLSAEEIARVMGESVPAVKGHLQRGMTLLRRKSEVLLREFVRG